MKDHYLWLYPEWVFPCLILGFIGFVKEWLPGIVLAGMGLAACWALTREGRGLEYRQMSEDILVSPAGGRIVGLECLRPLGVGRLVIHSGWMDPVYRIAPARGDVTDELDVAPGMSRVALKTEIGELKLSFEGYKVVKTDAAQRSAVLRGETVAAVKWEGLTTVEFPLQNMELLKEYGQLVRIGEPIARHTAVWR